MNVRDKLIKVLQDEFMFGPDSNLGDEALADILQIISQDVIGEDEVTGNKMYSYNFLYYTPRNDLRKSQRSKLERTEG